MPAIKMQALVNLRWKTIPLVEYLLDHAAEEFYGSKMATDLGIANAVSSRFLNQVARVGLLSWRWEDDAEIDGPRPRRRYFRFTPGGALRLRQELDAWHANPRREPEPSGG